MVAALAGASVALLFVVHQHLITLERRVGRLSRTDAKLDALLKHFEIEFDPMAGVSEEIDEALKRGDKIQAIKLYREATDVGLKEAKDYIGELQRR
jgi:hypothetical protein